jgi:hypothetical protein
MGRILSLIVGLASRCRSDVPQGVLAEHAGQEAFDLLPVFEGRHLPRQTRSGRLEQRQLRRRM